MSSWAIVALVGIVMWGIVEIARARAGIITDEDGNQKIAPRSETGSTAELEAAQRELHDLRERIKVLERIATDRGHLLADEIESLRGELPASFATKSREAAQ